MSASNAKRANELVRDYLKTAGDRLDAIQAGSEADSADVELIWAIRDLRWAVHHLLAIVVEECPSCHPSGGERYRSGEDIRQKEDGSLTCLTCGRVVSEPENV